MTGLYLMTHGLSTQPSVVVDSRCDPHVFIYSTRPFMVALHGSTTPCSLIAYIVLHCLIGHDSTNEPPIHQGVVYLLHAVFVIPFLTVYGSLFMTSGISLDVTQLDLPISLCRGSPHNRQKLNQLSGRI